MIAPDGTAVGGGPRKEPTPQRGKAGCHAGRAQQHHRVAVGSSRRQLSAQQLGPSRGAHDQLVQQVPKSALPDDLEAAVGMQLQSQSPDGQVMMFVVAEVGDDTITVDGNHPLAGHALNFDIELVSIA